MKIFITGAAGFIGSALTISLLERGENIVGIDNHNDYYDPKIKEMRVQRYLKHPNYTHLKLDLSDSIEIKKAFDQHKPEKVVNLAAQAGVRYSIENPLAYINSNILGFANILEGCRHNKIKHLVYASTSSVYGANTKMPFSEHESANHPLSVYAASKKSNELMAHTYSHLYKLPTTGLRFFTVYGPWGRPDMALFKFTRNILLNKPIEVFNHGKHKRDFTYIDDVVRSIYLTINKIPKKGSTNSLSNSQVAPFSILNIGGGKKVSLMKFIKEIENCLGLKAKIKYLPLQPGDVIKTSCNTNKIKSYLKFLPKTDYKQGIKNFVFWYKTFLK